METISVIVPIYNAEETLRLCLQTIVTQSYHQLQIILVNDGSTDGSFSICKEFQEQDSRIILINQENHGRGYTRNKGLAVATGEYVAFVDADDYIKPFYLEQLYRQLKKYNSDIAICDIFFEDLKCQIKLERN